MDTPSKRRDRCAAVRALVVSVGGYCKQKGFGGNMWGVGNAFKYALNTGRMVVFADEEVWTYVDPRDCKSRSWGCYFEPVSTCSEEVGKLRVTWIYCQTHNLLCQRQVGTY